jgi:phage shock protein A
MADIRDLASRRPMRAGCRDEHTSHITNLFKIKANKALDRAEDPREVLDYSYSQQMEMLQKVRRGLADVATSRKRVELQLSPGGVAAGGRGQARRRHAAA